MAETGKTHRETYFTVRFYTYIANLPDVNKINAIC